MKLVLVTRDGELFRSCRELFAGCGVLGGEIVLDVPDEGVFDSLCIWDYEPGAAPPLGFGSSHGRHFVLLYRKDVAYLRSTMFVCEPYILLKPLSPAALRAFFEQLLLAPERSAARAGTAEAERDDVLQCLIETNLKLQEYDQERTNFLARGVHDLRAPLTALAGYCGLLLSEQLGGVTDNQREVLERMQRSARRMMRLASTMFQLSVNGHVEAKLDLRIGDIRECVNQALHEILPLATEKHILISVEMEPPSEGLAFEGSQVEQVVVNLLDNACKFTPRRGSIRVRGYPYFWERRTPSIGIVGGSVDRRSREKKAPNAYRIDVQDTGVGIAAPHTEKIFEEYTSYAGSQDRSGAGLGLAICKMVIHQHQGHIWAENTSDGALFSFVLPLRRSEPVYLARQTRREMCAAASLGQ